MIRQVKSAAYAAYLNVLAHQRARLRWKDLVTRTAPRVYYGHDVIPGREENVGGGIIKAQDLQSMFPNTTHQANILYFISSTIASQDPIIAKYAKSRGARLVVNQNGTAYPAWHGQGWEKANRPMRQLLKLADYVIYQSNFCKGASDLHLTMRANNFEILHNPVDTEEFVPVSLPPDGHRLISAGTHRQFYRVECAVKAVEIVSEFIPDVTLTFAGRYHWHKEHARAERDLRELVKASKIRDRITINGGYSQTEIVPLLQDHHIALHTKYNDPCPRLVSEALACGLPVVYSSSGGVPELVGHSAGVGIDAPLDWNKLHAPPPEKLAAAVIKIFDNYEEYRKAARTRSIKKLDVRPWVKRHTAIFKELIK